MIEECRQKVKLDIASICEKFSIPKERILNADQTGLFYQKLPNHTFCDELTRDTIRGCKQMKDKTRITLMVCTSAGGALLKLSLVGEAKCLP